MRSWLTKTLVATVAIASVSGAPVAIALASSPHHAHRSVHAKRSTDPAPSENSGENAGEQTKGEESDSDSAQQTAACQRAGIDPNGSNVQYDGQTGACGAAGGAGGDQQQQ